MFLFLADAWIWTVMVFYRCTNSSISTKSSNIEWNRLALKRCHLKTVCVKCLTWSNQIFPVASHWAISSDAKWRQYFTIHSSIWKNTWSTNNVIHSLRNVIKTMWVTPANQVLAASSTTSPFVRISIIFSLFFSSRSDDWLGSIRRPRVWITCGRRRWRHSRVIQFIPYFHAFITYHPTSIHNSNETHSKICVLQSCPKCSGRQLPTRTISKICIGIWKQTRSAVVLIFNKRLAQMDVTIALFFFYLRIQIIDVVRLGSYLLLSTLQEFSSVLKIGGRSSVPMRGTVRSLINRNRLVISSQYHT